jgi:hypothetical protein
MFASYKMVSVLFTLLLWAYPARSISGIHSPIPIAPKVDIADNLWLLDLYFVLLNREQDAVGYRDNLQAMQFGGQSRQVVYDSFIYSQEFQSNPSLQVILKLSLVLELRHISTLFI